MSTTKNGRNVSPHKPKHYDYIFKILLIGDSGVGKTSILRRFIGNEFFADFLPTIGIDFKIRTVTLDGKTIKLQTWDTAGQERYQSITSSFYRGAHGIMIVYDITSEKSFNNIHAWLESLEANLATEVETIIVGNKCDLEELRQIPFTRGQEIASQHNLNFLEISAKNETNIMESFLSLVRSIKEAADKRRKTLNDADLPEKHDGTRPLNRLRLSGINHFLPSCTLL